MFNRRTIPALVGLLALAALAPTLANAQICTLTASGASYVIPAASHYDATQTSNLTGVGPGTKASRTAGGSGPGATRNRSFPSNTRRARRLRTITWTDVWASAFSATTR